jgi:beta-phosphoglucomutase-like phosphatase (HAD superfamily)
VGYHGIIFDFNGVLWWDRHLQEAAWSRYARQLRGDPFTAAEMAEQMHGRANGAVLQYLAGRALSPAEVARMTQEKETIYRELCLAQGDGFRLSPGAVALCDWLVAHGVPRTIATASEATNLAFFVKYLHLDRWFDVGRIAHDDGTIPNKPAPDIYLRAAAALALAPQACVVVEDSRSGIAAARAAGIGRIVGLGPPSRHAELAALPGVDQVIVDLSQLPRAVLLG